MQGVLGRDRWDSETMRELLCREVIGALGDPAGLLVVDETGFIKKGEHSVGVTRQCVGAVDRRANCQVGVFLGYASRFGQALIDGRLYLPESWAHDTARRDKTSVPEEVGFATKPIIACDLIGHALDAGVPCAFVLGDAVYGSDKELRRMLEERSQPYVLAVPGDQTLRPGDTPFRSATAERIVQALAHDAWARHVSAEGPRCCGL